MKKLPLFLLGILAGAIPTAIAATALFSDVSESDWYANAVSSLSEKGIIEGYEDGTFGPSNNVNRAELAVMLDRTISYLESEETSTDDDSGYELHKVSVSDSIPTDTDGFGFTNDDFDDSYFLDGDNLYVTAGYGGGCSDHSFEMMWDGKFVSEAKTNLYLIHNANGEICNNYKTEILKFDLEKVREVYGETFPEETVDGTGSGTVTADKEVTLNIYTGVGKTTKVSVKYSVS